MNKEIEEKYQLIMATFRTAADNLNSMNKTLTHIANEQKQNEKTANICRDRLRYR